MSKIVPTQKKPKSPILAALLNIVFGIGYLYIGNIGRFVIYWIAVIGVSAGAELFGFGRYSTTINAFVVLALMADAYNLTQKYNEKLSLPPAK